MAVSHMRPLRSVSAVAGVLPTFHARSSLTKKLLDWLQFKPKPAPIKLRVLLPAAKVFLLVLMLPPRSEERRVGKEC